MDIKGGMRSSIHWDSVLCLSKDDLGLGGVGWVRYAILVVMVNFIIYMQRWQRITYLTIPLV